MTNAKKKLVKHAVLIKKETDCLKKPSRSKKIVSLQRTTKIGLFPLGTSDEFPSIVIEVEGQPRFRVNNYLKFPLTVRIMDDSAFMKININKYLKSKPIGKY